VSLLDIPIALVVLRFKVLVWLLLCLPALVADVELHLLALQGLATLRALDWIFFAQVIVFGNICPLTGGNP
jgi:hypothetical protein